MKEMIERAEQLAKSINDAHWCTDGLSFEDVVSRLILRELQEERKMQKAIDDAKYKKLRKLAYDMYTAAQYLTTDASILRKAIDAFHQFISYEESIMED